MLISRHVWEGINTEAALRLLSGNGIEGLCWESYSPWAAGCCAWGAPRGESMRDSSLPSHPPHPPYGHLLTSSPPHLQSNTARDSPFNSASIWGSHDGFWGPGRPWHTPTPSSPDPYLSCEAHRSVIGSAPSSQGTVTILGSTQTHTSSIIQAALFKWKWSSYHSALISKHTPQEVVHQDCWTSFTSHRSLPYNCKKCLLICDLHLKTDIWWLGW